MSSNGLSLSGCNFSHMVACISKQSSELYSFLAGYLMKIERLTGDYQECWLLVTLVCVVGSETVWRSLTSHQVETKHHLLELVWLVFGKQTHSQMISGLWPKNPTDLPSGEGCAGPGSACHIASEPVCTEQALLPAGLSWQIGSS